MAASFGGAHCKTVASPSQEVSGAEALASSSLSPLLAKGRAPQSVPHPILRVQPQQQPQQQQQQQQQASEPTRQSPAGENAMSVVMVGAECAPWSKTGACGCL